MNRVVLGQQVESSYIRHLLSLCLIIVLKLPQYKPSD